MAWGRTSDKPLSEPIMNQINDAYLRRCGEISQKLIRYIIKF